MSEQDLFGPTDAGEAGGASGANAMDAEVGAPLAARMRPRTLEEFVGQEHLLGPGRALRELIEKDEIGSLLLWGPPGTGKTTLARIIAARTAATFVPFSAVTEGVARVREIITEAGARKKATGRRTILFCDEIHRFNKAQQDAFLPHVEAGTISLIGATTENPSFEVIGALLSRSRVVVLEPLDESHIAIIVQRALEDRTRGLGDRGITIDEDAIRTIAREADGDARRALTALETAATLSDGGRIDERTAKEALQLRFAHHDKGGDQHYDMLSAYHKSLRGSDAQAAIYWMARMIEGGADPRILFRRALAMASEDIGLADPTALQVAVAARQAFDVLGPPEGFLALAEMTLYLATAPKSNASYRALASALEAARETPAAPVPMPIRNAPTPLMKELGYGKGYRYAHDFENAFAAQDYLPDVLLGRAFYEPGEVGFEKRIAERMAWWEALKRGAPGGEVQQAKQSGTGGGEDGSE
ncbi:MAG: replication-associated recombination protein A [Longimicrobiales bacterium]